jgi:hypothetical protein
MCVAIFICNGHLCERILMILGKSIIWVGKPPTLEIQRGEWPLSPILQQGAWSDAGMFASLLPGFWLALAHHPNQAALLSLPFPSLPLLPHSFPSSNWKKKCPCHSLLGQLDPFTCLGPCLEEHLRAPRMDNFPQNFIYQRRRWQNFSQELCISN